MATDDEIAQLRAQGLTPKAIAKRLGLRPAEVTTAIQRLAAAAPRAEQRFVGAWVSTHWTEGLGFDERVAHWKKYDVAPPLYSEGTGAVQVLLAREGRHGHVVVAGFLCDVWCTGVKNALGPKTMTPPEFEAYGLNFFRAHEGAGPIPLEVAQAIVLGSEAYARSLGLEPHPDFAKAKALLGADAPPPGIVFGNQGRPHYVPGMDDDSTAIRAALARWEAAEAS